MSETPKQCPLCPDSEMEKGNIADRTVYSANPAVWVKDKPDYSLGGIENDMVYVIDAWRCIDCGYLALYAPTATIDGEEEGDVEEN